jgi:hypothetical protein
MAKRKIFCRFCLFPSLLTPLQGAKNAFVVVLHKNYKLFAQNAVMAGHKRPYHSAEFNQNLNS